MKKYKKLIISIYFLAIMSVFSFAVCQAGHDDITEAFLTKDVVSLSPKIKNYPSNTLKKYVEMREIDEAHYLSILPVCPIDHPDEKSKLSGQIRNLHDDGIGTGTIIEMQNEGGGRIRVVGVTALHNFVGHYGELQTVSEYNRNFVLASKNGAPILGQSSIDKVMVQEVPSKDICLFEGYFDCLPTHLYSTNDEFYSHFSPKLPTIAPTEISAATAAVMYHYPLGTKDQRWSRGTASEDGKHIITSLAGSSGAALFDEAKPAEIFGVHVGYSKMDINKNVVVEYKNKKDMLVTDYNKFEKFSVDDLNTLKGGVNLFDGRASDQRQEFIVNLSAFALDNFTPLW